MSSHKAKALKERIKRGKQQKKYEYEANPEMHAFKNSMRRKGFSDGKIFSGALRQAERYNKKGDDVLDKWNKYKKSPAYQEDKNKAY